MNTTSFYADYSAFTATTARYPAILERPYLALGLCDEICDEFNRAMERGEANNMFLELGDGQWYACRLSNAFGFEFSEIVEHAKIVYGEMLQSGSVGTVQNPLYEIVKQCGAVAGRVKKYERDRETWNEHTLADFHEVLRVMLVRFVALSMMCIDVIWRIDQSVGNYDDCLRRNMDKLSGRLNRDTLRGEGDHR
jgi:hypothetical protein